MPQFPRDAQRDALSAETLWQARSILALFPGKGSTIFAISKQKSDEERSQAHPVGPKRTPDGIKLMWEWYFYWCWNRYFYGCVSHGVGLPSSRVSMIISSLSCHVHARLHHLFP